MRNFEAWKESLQEDAALYGGDILATDDPKLLCSCLCKKEERKMGTRIYHVLSSLYYQDYFVIPQFCATTHFRYNYFVFLY